MWKNSLKNVECDNKILYETLLDFFYSEAVLSFWTSLVFGKSAEKIQVSLKSENNKILYETLLDFFYNETVLTFWINLSHSSIQIISRCII